MHNGFKERCLSYYSGLVYPVYEHYKLKDDTKYAIQRFCSLQTFSEYSIQPTISDYKLCECGLLTDDAPLEQMIESIIDKKNSFRNNSISVGDVIKVFRATNRYLYFVDPVGLKPLNAF